MSVSGVNCRRHSLTKLSESQSSSADQHHELNLVRQRHHAGVERGGHAAIRHRQDAELGQLLLVFAEHVERVVL